MRARLSVGGGEITTRSEEWNGRATTRRNGRGRHGTTGDEWRAVGAGWPPLRELVRARRRMRVTSPSDCSAARDDQWGTAQAAAHQ